eukprot:4514335-Prymnesium_polylepis.1
MTSEGLGATTLVLHSEGCSRELMRRKFHGDPRSPCYFQVAPLVQGCSTSDFTASGAAELVAGGKPVSMMQNVASPTTSSTAERSRTTSLTRHG